MSNHTKEPWLCDKRTGHTLNPQTASTAQGGVVSPQVRCDNCNTVVTQGEAKTLFCSGEINGVPRHVISLCPSCAPTKKRRKFGMKTNHSNAVSELVTAPTREQSVLAWAIHCDLIDSRGIDEEFVKSMLEKLREFSDLAYTAGQADERAACAKACEDFAGGTSAYEVHHRFAAYKCAEIIRKRGGDENIS